MLETLPPSGTRGDWNRVVKHPLAICAILLVVNSVSQASAVTPREDFAAWYVQWIEELPKWNQGVYKQFFGAEKGKPLVMRGVNWASGDYRLTSVDNSKVKDSFKLLVNPHYAANIVTTLGAKDSIWSLKDVAMRSDDHFEALASSFGMQPELIYEHKKLFAKKRLSSETTAVPGEPGKLCVAWQYDSAQLKKPREIEQIEFILDESVGWMP